MSRYSDQKVYTLPVLKDEYASRQRTIDGLIKDQTEIVEAIEALGGTVEQSSERKEVKANGHTASVSPPNPVTALEVPWVYGPPIHESER